MFKDILIILKWFIIVNSLIKLINNFFVWFNYYYQCPNLFVLFEKSKFLRKNHLLSCLLYKNV